MVFTNRCSKPLRARAFLSEDADGEDKPRIRFLHGQLSSSSSSLAATYVRDAGPSVCYNYSAFQLKDT